MLEKIQYICLVCGIGLIGADRIDLFLRKGPFILTPFLVFGTLVVMISLLRMMIAKDVSLTITKPIERQRPYVIVATTFTFLALLSIPFGLDPARGLLSFFDLALLIGFGYCIAVLILSHPQRDKLIVRSITFALIADACFFIGEFVAWSHGIMIHPDQKLRRG